MRPLAKISTVWSTELAYAIGLITSDGCLSSDRRHIDLTSKDKEQIELFKKCLGIKNKIRMKASGYSIIKRYFSVQFGDVNFYRFLLSVGLTSKKSRTLKSLEVPDEYFADFLRGCIDGDGNISISYHHESKYPQLKVRLVSASYKFIEWTKRKIAKNFDIQGGWITKNSNVFVLCYGKTDAQRILQFIYYNNTVPCLYRKYILARPFLGTIIKLIKSLGFTPPIYSS